MSAEFETAPLLTIGFGTMLIRNFLAFGKRLKTRYYVLKWGWWVGCEIAHQKMKRTSFSRERMEIDRKIKDKINRNRSMIELKLAESGFVAYVQARFTFLHFFCVYFGRKPNQAEDQRIALLAATFTNLCVTWDRTPVSTLAKLSMVKTKEDLVLLLLALQAVELKEVHKRLVLLGPEVWRKLNEEKLYQRTPSLTTIFAEYSELTELP